MTTPRAEIVAGLAHHWHRHGHALPPRLRRRALDALAGASPMIRTWHQWERLFLPLYLTSVITQGAGILALALHARPLLVAGTVLAGTVINAHLAVHLWRTAEQALDIAAGLIARSERARRGG